MFERLHQDPTTQGLTALGINFREGSQTIQQYAEKLDVTVPLLLDSKGEIANSCGVIGLPTTVMIGRYRRSVALTVGSRALSSVGGRTIILALWVESAVQKELP